MNFLFNRGDKQAAASDNGSDGSNNNYEEVCRSIGRAASIEFCEVCPEVRGYLADFCEATAEERNVWEDDIWASAPSKKVGKKYKGVVDQVQMLPDGKGRGAPLMKFKATMNFGGNEPSVFFDLMDVLELRKNGIRIQTL